MKGTFKKIIAAALTFSVLTLSASGVYAQSADSENLVDTFSYEREIHDENNNVIGVITTEVSREIKTEEDGTKVITLEKDIVEEYNDGEEEQYNKTHEIKITPSGEYYLNGEKLDEDFLNQSVNVGEKNKYAFKGESGGYLATYEEISPNFFKLASYKEANFFLDYSSRKTFTSTYVGEDNHARDINRFMTKADGVEDARDDISALTAALSAELGIAVITAGTVLGAIASGTAAAITASELLDASEEGHEDLEDAYYLIKNMGS
ncbi:hypothetical protein [Brevibacillus parabrevis]|uniref:hypothetical protein n=1 Tax=Brevibacillus parabrevis TaxID=54914 RepID=UPI0028D25E4C|nr:hypothetical protein [Brevibacillus parabrevis]MED1725130.1 hypothetical protein [Brevibacillus parabrevis]